MRKRLNVKNLIKLIVMVVSIIIIVSSFLNVIVNSLKGFTMGFTWFGMFTNLILVFTIDFIYDDLFGRD